MLVRMESFGKLGVISEIKVKTFTVVSCSISKGKVSGENVLLFTAKLFLKKVPKSLCLFLQKVF